MTSTTKLTEWKKLADAATPGPWQFMCLGGPLDPRTDTYGIRSASMLDEITIHSRPETAHANAAFIAESRTALPRLVEACEVMLEELWGIEKGYIEPNEMREKAKNAQARVASILEGKAQ